MKQLAAILLLVMPLLAGCGKFGQSDRREIVKHGELRSITAGYATGHPRMIIGQQEPAPGRMEAFIILDTTIGTFRFETSDTRGPYAQLQALENVIAVVEKHDYLPDTRVAACIYVFHSATVDWRPTTTECRLRFDFRNDHFISPDQNEDRLRNIRGYPFDDFLPDENKLSDLKVKFSKRISFPFEFHETFQQAGHGGGP